MKLRRFLATAAAVAVASSALAISASAAIKDYPDGFTLDLIAEGYDVTEVYGFTFVISGDIDSGAGGGVGFNSLSTGWDSTEWGNADAGKAINASGGEVTILRDAPVFAETDVTDPENPHAQVWMQHWWGADITIDDVIILGADGVELTLGADEPVDAPVVDEPVEEPTDDIVIDEPAALTLEECYDGNGTIILVGENGENAYATSNGIDILDVYGYRVTAQFPMAEVNDEEAWIGGGMGTNSNSTGWASTEWGKASGEKPIVTEFDEQGLVTLELLSDASLFAADDAYAQLWIQCWGGTMNIISVEVLGAEGAVIAEATVGEIAAVEDAPAADDTVVDTDAPAADTGKDSPDTGVEGIAAVAGVVALAGVAVVASRKRK